MILKSKETMVAYRCPHCGTSILSMVGIFALSGDLIKLKCDCGESELVLMRQPNDRVKITVPCLICPNPHVFTLSMGSFFSTELITLACPIMGLNMLYIGKEQPVRDALDETERELDRMLDEYQLEGFDKLKGENYSPDDEPLDAELIHLTNFVISELEEDEAIECDCTRSGDEGEYDFETDGRTVIVFCKKCDCEAHVRVETQTQLENFAMLDKLVLKQRND